MGQQALTHHIGRVFVPCNEHIRTMSFCGCWPYVRGVAGSNPNRIGTFWLNGNTWFSHRWSVGSNIIWRTFLRNSWPNTYKKVSIIIQGTSHLLHLIAACQIHHDSFFTSALDHGVFITIIVLFLKSVSYWCLCSISHVYFNKFIFKTISFSYFIHITAVLFV